MVKDTVIPFLVGVILGLLVLMIFSLEANVYMQERSIINQTKTIALLRDRLRKLSVICVERVSCYSPRESECDSSPRKTATMRRVIPGWTCAVSRDLAYLLGARIYIEGLGVWCVNDLMNPRFHKSIDLCLGSPKACRQFGVRKNVKVIYLGKED